MVTYFSILAIVLLIVSGNFAQQWYQLKSIHQARKLSDDQLQRVATLSDMRDFDAILDPILVPRVVGSANHERVKQFIVDQMASLNWDVEVNKFDDRTPFGKKTFANIIATLNPNSQRRLVLACHYDSKFSAGDTFLGATDSAVPCSMMIKLARDLAPQLEQLRKSNSDVSLQFIFFDGEEAFVNWSAQDSIYGARHLAKKWSSTPFPERNQDRTTFLSRMDLLVLLDLLGTRNPTILDHVPSGSRWFKHVVDIERRLKRAQLLVSNSPNFFQLGQSFGGIEDDHIPFMKKGVPVFHVIPAPFPSVWHTDDDNKAALDYSTIDDLNKIFRVFVAEYLQLNI